MQTIISKRCRKGFRFPPGTHLNHEATSSLRSLWAQIITSGLIIGLAWALCVKYCNHGDDYTERGAQIPLKPNPLTRSAGQTPEKKVERPSILKPTFIPASEAGLSDGTAVLGVTIGGASRAYPLLIIDKHRIVNDTVGHKHILVSSACPYSNKIVVHDRTIDGNVLVMKTSKTEAEIKCGIKNLTMYDDETGSLWLEKTGEALEGSMKGKALLEISESEYQPRTRWGDWKRTHPDTLLLVCDHCNKKNIKEGSAQSLNKNHTMLTLITPKE